MAKVLRVLFMAVGAILVACGIFMGITTNYNSGIVMMALLGAVFLLYGIFYHKINSATKHGVGRVIKYVVVICLLAALGLSVFIFSYGNIDNVSYDEDAVIVLGCGLDGEYPSLTLINRLDAAIRYCEENQDALIVVSGGQGFQESIPEAEAMERYLIQSGVEPDRIIKEDKSSSTYENMKFSKEILERIFKGNDYKVTVITNDYHIFRAVQIAKDAGFYVSHYHGRTELYNIVPSYLRETAAIAVTFLTPWWSC